MKKNITIDFIRVFACFLIVWNHASNHMYFEKIGGGEAQLWANIGVQIFFFMSGYLYGGRSISNITSWYKKEIIKIIQPYWLYLMIILPLILLISPSHLNWLKVIASFICIQGFSINFQIEGLGQLWFISYILLCYFITPYILKFIQKYYLSVDTYNINYKLIFFSLFFFMIVFQIITIPFAIFFNFKVAYVFTYVIGLLYGSLFKEVSSNFSCKQCYYKRNIDIAICSIAFFGVFIRLFISNYPFPISSLNSLLVQWIKLFQGAALFIVLFRFVRQDYLFRYSKVVIFLSSISYEIYIVHEFFTCDIFTSFLYEYKVNYFIIILLVLISIFLSAYVLNKLKKIFFCPVG